jgi:uncharacterized protein YdeI (YjbR/CyaY-like superfamily)
MRRAPGTRRRRAPSGDEEGDVPRIHEAETFQAETRGGWRAWLERNHQRREGIWLITFRKSSGHPHVTYEEAVEEALCFGWIDSRPGTVDDERSRLWFTRRKPGSRWSRANRERVERLTATGRMAPPGLAAVEAAKRDGTWDALDDVQANVVPDDLADALAADPIAAGNFAAFPPSSKRIILEWILGARRPETRAARIAETVRLAAVNERANHWRR